MLELLHAVIASLVLSTGLGGGVDKPADTDDDSGGSETGIDVGTMPPYLVSPRGLTKAEQAEQNDDLPEALPSAAASCQPLVWVQRPAHCISTPCQAVVFPTAGRSP